MVVGEEVDFPRRHGCTPRTHSDTCETVVCCALWEYHTGVCLCACVLVFFACIEKRVSQGLPHAAKTRRADAQADAEQPAK